MATLTATLVGGGTTNVRLELDWTSLPEVEYVKIVRLRPGESYNATLNTGGTAIRLPNWGNTFTDDYGTWTYLSAGRGIWYDTEAPLDVAVSYVAVAMPYTTLARDAFTRSLSNDWGSPDFGPSAYTESNTAADYDVNGTKGTIQPTTTAADRAATVNFLVSTALEVRATFAWNTLPASGQLRAGAVVLSAGVTDHYSLETQIDSAGVVTSRVVRRTASVPTVIASKVLRGTAMLYTAAAVWRFLGRVDTATSTFSFKAWPSTMGEPADWQVTVVDTTQTGPSAGLYARNDTAATTHIVSFDDMLMSELTRDTVTVATAGTVTVLSASALWLKDPLRPGNDIPLNLCPTGPSGCTQPTGVFFHSMGTLSRTADAQVRGMGNRVVPSATFRARKAPTSELRVVARTLADRDDVLALLAPGSPLLLQAPAVYGLPDRYLLVGDAAEERVHVDHRLPFRMFTMPWSEVDAPLGGGEGTPETRWDDLCTNYATWTLLIAAGWTWLDVMQGDAA